MTKQELIEKFNIPAELIDKYEKFRKCTCYNDNDLELISMIMTLYDAGFDDTETEKYIRLCLCGGDTSAKRAEMLAAKRKATLSDIHSKQKHLDSIDYLRYQITKKS